MTEGRLGRYELHDLLGEGGFARVYSALDPVLGREVALKTLLPWQVADPEIRRRFLAEAQALAALRHPNIVTVYDVGEADGVPFFTMERIEGRTLGQILSEEGPQPLGRVTELIRALGSAIAYLHSAGLVHRDIKPANIMVEPSGRPVLMDFGIARSLDGARLTQTGASIGTPAYMAPEQVRGEVVGPPADVYALGVVTYQLLAGRPPFAGDTAHVLHAQAYDPPPPLRATRPDLPPTAHDAVARALAKQPEHRPAAGALADLLVRDQTPTQLLTPLPATVRVVADAPAARTRGRGRLLALAVVALVLVIGGGVTIVALMRGGGRSNTSSLLAATVLATRGQGTRTVVPSTGTPATTPGAASAAQATAAPSALAPTTAQPFSASFASTGDDAGWAAGRTPWNATLVYQHGPPDAALAMRIVPSAAPDDAVAQSAITRLDADAGTIALSVPAVGVVAPGNYLVRLFLVQGNVWTPAGSRGLAVALPTASPSPPATAPPTTPPTRPPAQPPPANTANTALHAGNWARTSTPGDCLVVRTTAGASATKLDCAWDGSDLYLFDGPVTADGEPWWHVRVEYGASQETGYVLGTYLVPSAGPATLNVVGSYSLTDYVLYGIGAGQSTSWNVSLSQNGTHVSGRVIHAPDGNPALLVDGDLSGRVLHLQYQGGGQTGQFWWQFTPDGTRFEGAFDYLASGSDIDGGTSYGARQGAGVSSQPQATVFVVGANAVNGVIARGQTVYICAIVSAPSDLVINAQPTRLLYSGSDGGTGVCQSAVITPDPDGYARFSSIMAQNRVDVAGGNVIVSVR